jgi:hypothetical protein
MWSKYQSDHDHRNHVPVDPIYIPKAPNAERKKPL